MPDWSETTDLLGFGYITSSSVYQSLEKRNIHRGEDLTLTLNTVTMVQKAELGRKVVSLHSFPRMLRPNLFFQPFFYLAFLFFLFPFCSWSKSRLVGSFLWESLLHFLIQGLKLVQLRLLISPQNIPLFVSISFDLGEIICFISLLYRKTFITMITLGSLCLCLSL